jgi:hypothetical protein
MRASLPLRARDTPPTTCSPRSAAPRVGGRWFSSAVLRSANGRGELHNMSSAEHAMPGRTVRMAQDSADCPLRPPVARSGQNASEKSAARSCTVIHGRASSNPSLLREWREGIDGRGNELSTWRRGT